MISLTKNLSKDWCIRNKIMERVQKENYAEWALKETKVKLPKYEKVKKEKLSESKGLCYNTRS